jgi:DNA-binding GntR family transcriptional regulator
LIFRTCRSSLNRPSNSERVTAEHGTKKSDRGAAVVASSLAMNAGSTAAQTGSPPGSQTKATVVEHIVDTIVERIKVGRYSPGQRLIEAELTVDFGVSRGPLREALSRLASRGLVDIAPHRGAVVRKMTRTDVAELFAMRELLEGEAARLAAQNIDRPGVRKTFQVLARTMRGYRTSPDWQSYASVNTELHAAIVGASGNSLLQHMVDQLSTQSFRMQFRSTIDGRVLLNSLQDHEAILAAILAGDQTAAGEHMRAHVRRSGEEAMAQPDIMFG